MPNITCPHCGSETSYVAPTSSGPPLCEVCFEPIQPAKAKTQSARPQSRPSGTKRRPKKSKGKKRRRNPAEAQKRKIILGMSIAGGCILLLIIAIGTTSYLIATSISTRMQQLASDDPQDVETALAALEAAGTDALPQLVEGIKGESASVRGHCLTLLKKLGPKADSAINDLESGIDDDNKQVRIACITAIGYLGKSGQPAESRILKLLYDTDGEIRAASFETLAAISSPEKIVARLTEIVKADNDELQLEAVVQLGKYGRQATSAVPVLLTIIEKSTGTDGQNVKESVCEALGKIGHRDEQVYKKLSAIFLDADENPECRSAAALALGNIGGPQAVEPLSKVLLATQAPDIIAMTATGIGALGSEANAGKALENLNTAKANVEKLEKAELDEARKEEEAKPVTPPKYKNVIIIPSRSRRGRDTRKEWYTFQPARRPAGLARNARFHSVQVSGGGGPSEDALRETQKGIKKKWQAARDAIEGAKSKIRS